MQNFTNLLAAIQRDLWQIDTHNEVSDLSSVPQVTVEAALRLGVKCYRYKNSSLIVLEKNNKNVFLVRDGFSTTSSLSVSIARNKFLTHEILRSLGVRTPKSDVVSSENDLFLKIKNFTLSRVVLKPNESSRGFLVKIGAKNIQELSRHFKKIKQMRDEAILEEKIKGESYRVLLIGHKVISVIFQKKPRVVGDGQKTVLKLVRNLNKKRKASRMVTPQVIRINQDLKDVLAEQGFGMGDVPPKNKTLILSKTSNMSRGSEPHDMTSRMHPETKKVLGKITKHLNLDIAGIDLISPDITSSIQKTGVVLEINARPGFYGHVYPVSGPSAPVGDEVIKYLFG